MRTPRFAPLISLALALTASSAHAQWPPTGLPLAAGPNLEFYPDGIAHSDGSLHAFWIDGGPAPYAIYSQRVTLGGSLAPGWPAGGRGATTSSARPNDLVVSPDGQEGALLAWYDFRAAAEPRGIYGARVNAQGNVVLGWSADGTPVCTALNPEGQGPLTQLMQVCSDGAGGGFFAWTDARDTPPQQTLVYHVYGQHIGPTGVRDPAWPAEGKLLVGGAGYHYPQALLPDAAGGFWLGSEDDAGGIAVTHHASNGNQLGRWTTAYAASQPSTVADGAGGVYLAWRDFRAGQSSAPDIYVMRLGSGAVPRPGWTATGVAVATTSAPENVPVITQSQGAVIVAWLNETSGATFYAARRFEPSGTPTPGWPAAGVRFSRGPLLDGRALAVPDGAGGAMFAFRRNTPNLFGSRVTSAGVIPPAFPDTGLSLCSLTGNQFLEDLVFDGFVGAYVLWGDMRDYATNRTDVYATRFTRDGLVGSTVDTIPPVVPPGLSLAGPFPNPMGRDAWFSLSMPAAARVHAEVFDLSGRRVATLVDAVLPATPHLLRWNGLDEEENEAPRGIYLMRISVGTVSLTRRIVRLE